MSGFMQWVTHGIKRGRFEMDRRTAFYLITFVVVMTLVATFYLMLVSQTAARGRHIQQLQVELFRLQRENEQLEVEIDNILVGNGSTELIRLAALANFSQGDRVIIIKPTFGEYEIACQIVGATTVEQRLLPEKEFQLEVAETTRLIRRHRPKGIFITNPNNPGKTCINTPVNEGVF